MNNNYPLMVNFREKSIVVVGGGTVAERKVASLLDLGAQIDIISPSLSPRLRSLVQKKKVNWQNKRFQRRDVCDAFFIIAATDDPNVNKQVVNACSTHQLVLNVSDGNEGNVMMPAVTQRGKLTVAVSTNGASPLVAKRIREQISDLMDHNELDAQIDTIARQRADIIQHVKNRRKKKSLLEKLTKEYFM